MPKANKSCKSCGGSDHCRRSSKKCSQYIPRSNRLVPRRQKVPQKFVSFTTTHVDDRYGRNNVYFYDKTNDTLWTKVGYKNSRIDLGTIRQYKKYTLQQLIGAYESACSDYNELRDEIDALFRKIERKKESGHYDRDDIDMMYAEFYHDLRPQKYEISNTISFYYYLIAKSPQTVHSLQTLAIKAISEHDVNYASLPRSLQNRIRDSV